MVRITSLGIWPAYQKLALSHLSESFLRFKGRNYLRKTVGTELMLERAHSSLLEDDLPPEN
jgi:hypothetical protein